MNKYGNYIVEVICRNCRLRAKIKIPVGWAIEEKECPKCRLKELHNIDYYGIKSWQE